MTANERVRISSPRGQSIAGRIVFASENRRSLMLLLDDALDCGHGIYTSMVPVLMDAAGDYRELVGNSVLTIEPVQ